VKGRTVVLSSIDTVVSETVVRVLGVPDAPPDANFFGLGGDSLAALEVIASIQDELGCELSLELLFEYPTLGEFAEQVKDVAAAQGAVVERAN
jgi:acyl carrier protein